MIYQLTVVLQLELYGNCPGRMRLKGLFVASPWRERERERERKREKKTSDRLPTTAGPFFFFSSYHRHGGRMLASVICVVSLMEGVDDGCSLLRLLRNFVFLSFFYTGLG